jgi:hypothetical protein
MAGHFEAVAPLARKILWVDTKAGVNRLIIGLVVLCVFLFAMDFIWHRHVKVPGEELTGFHAIAGFVSFTVIVIAARLLRLVIKRDESFYAPNGVDAEAYPAAGTQPLSFDERPRDSLATLRDEMLGRDRVASAAPGTAGTANTDADRNGGAAS